MLRYMTDRARPGLVALYDIWPGNGAGQFLQPRSLHGANNKKITFTSPFHFFHVLVSISNKTVYSGHICHKSIVINIQLNILK